MATWKQVILKDPITGEYLAPMGGNFSGGDADTLQSHPASDFLLKSEYTPVDLSEYLKTATADTKYAAANHNHNGVYAPATHTHTTANITGLDTKLSGYDSEIANLKSSVSEGKSLVAAAVTDKGVTTAADAAFQTIADNIGKIETGSKVWAGTVECVSNLSFEGNYRYTGTVQLSVTCGFKPTHWVGIVDVGTPLTWGAGSTDSRFIIRDYNAYTGSFGNYGGSISNPDTMPFSERDFICTVNATSTGVVFKLTLDNANNGFRFAVGNWYFVCWE